MQHILIIDDSESVRESMRLTVVNAGYQATVASDGSEALRVLKDKGPFALVITDIFMPEIDGIELVEKIKASQPDQKVIAFSAGGMGLKSSEMLEVAKEMGADITLEKPFTDEQLIERIQELTGTSQ
ncbi:MAG: response regulator [Verrucomicrobiota bacterium]